MVYYVYHDNCVRIFLLDAVNILMNLEQLQRELLSGVPSP